MAYSTIPKSSSYFNPKAYTGTGSSNALTGVGFEPSFTWIKSRSNSYSHTLTDAVRGVTKHNASNNSNVEYTSTTEITSFDSDGFTVGTDSGVNNNGSTFASWNWKAGTAVSGATTGSGTAKTYTGSVNTTAGVSIIRYTGNSASGHQIPHRLGVAPKMIIVKCLNQAQTWTVYHQSLGSGTPQNYWLHLDTTDAQISGLGIWNNTAPNATNFTVGDSDNVNGGLNYVAYCFANIQGYSKFGSYVGNGNANGSFIYTGFKPAFVMSKYASGGGTGSWHMYDNKRKGYNTENDYVQANTTSSENSDTDQVDLLSNGFKWRANGSETNTNGGTFIYMAFGQPIVSTNGDIATER